MSDNPDEVNYPLITRSGSGTNLECVQMTLSSDPGRTAVPTKLQLQSLLDFRDCLVDQSPPIAPNAGSECDGQAASFARPPDWPDAIVHPCLVTIEAA